MNDEEKNKFSPKAAYELFRNIVRLTKMIWKEKRWLVIAFTSVMFVISLTPFLRSGAQGLLINELIHVAGSGTVTSYVLLLVAAVILSGLINPVLSKIQEYVDRLFYLFLGEKFEIMFVKKMGELDIATHEDPKQNNIITRVREFGIYRIQNFVDREFFILQNVIEVIVASTILLVSQWWVFLIIFAGTIPELVTEMKYGRDVWSIHQGRSELRRRFDSVRRHFYSVFSIVELKLFQNARHFLSIIGDLFHRFQEEERVAERKKIKSKFIALIFSQTTMAIATAWFIYEVIRGNMLVGTLVFVWASMGALRDALSSLFMNFGRQYQDSLFVTDAFKFLDIPQVINKPERGIILDPHTTPEIVFENITFAYPETKKFVLKNFSLRIKPGDKVAIVGVNGAGKTTFVKLLCRFYDPTHGRILINGHDLKEIDLASWYHQLGALFQDYDRYHFIVRDAIAVGRTGEKPTLQKVKDAARAGEADAFIEEWEHAYNQMLGKHFTGGIEPSIGQWQKLGLARTFYRDPRVLILDEPTSSIDAEAEEKIFNKLESLPKDRSVILISHRFSTVRRASQIVVIQDGKIKELGTHAKLLKKKGTYARLFNLQAKGYQ